MTRNYPGLPEGEAGRLSGGQRTIQISPSLPFQPPKVLTIGDGDTLFSEWTATYPDGSTYQVVSILKMANHQIIEETSYFAEPFDAPDWRAPYRESP